MVRKLGFFLFLSGCIALPDPDVPDASVRDSGVSDASVDSARDASRPDARVDAPPRDASREASVLDASPGDAALDAELDAAMEAGTEEPPRILISELRMRGPEGGNDEFVEITNASDHVIVISGFKLRAVGASGTVNTRAVVPQGVMLAPGGSFLFANSGASGYSGSAPADATYTFGLADECGVAITDASGVVLDAFTTLAGAPLGEGTARPALATSEDRAHARRMFEGDLVDTNDNASDFETAMPSTPRSQKGELPLAP